MKEVIEKLNEEILNGLQFSTPGETEKARRDPFYCSQLSVRNCELCSLVNYGRDCHNNEVELGLSYPTGWASPPRD